MPEHRSGDAGRRAPSTTGVEAAAYRPSKRPPLALLCVLDDGSDDGEWFRIRSESFVIGRGEGDLIIRHESLMSGRHAEITRAPGKDGIVWHLRDLGSTNGSYVRVNTAHIESGQQLVIGGKHLRFEETATGAELVELTAGGEGLRYAMEVGENWVGRDPRHCTVVLADDPMTSPRHAHLYRGEQGWMVADAHSRNGTWFRVQKARLKHSSQFQLGEQRFLFRLP